MGDVYCEAGCGTALPAGRNGSMRFCSDRCRHRARRVRTRQPVAGGRGGTPSSTSPRPPFVATGSFRPTSSLPDFVGDTTAITQHDPAAEAAAREAAPLDLLTVASQCARLAVGHGLEATLLRAGDCAVLRLRAPRGSGKPAEPAEPTVAELAREAAAAVDRSWAF